MKKNRNNPFPGLRPFRPEEAHLFFGREDQIADLVQRLRRNRFVAVVGASGSGKSSLVNAGLLPALDKGLPTRYGTKWRIAVLRPGNAPIRKLVDALGQPGVLGTDDEDKAALQATLLDTALRRSALGLLDAAAQALLPKGENLLVVVDQFEELFRFKEEAQIRSREARKAQETQEAQKAQDPDEAAAFVKLLLEAARSERAPIYIMLTMRSDYLGDCVQFRDLPEAINDGQFLVPRMTRDHRQMAIEGPVAVGKGLIKKRLVQRLLNDMGDNPDQLPIMQHALMRTWDYWSDQGDGEPLDIEHYEAIGTMARALSQHADEVYNELPEARQEIAERMFKRLTEKGQDKHGIRRPTRLDQLCIVCQADEEEVKAVIEAFRRPDRSLLLPEAGKPLKLHTFIDISHESLMRVWERLKVWVDEEAEGVALYRRLAETAALEAQGKASLWHDTDLHLALDFRKKSKPSAAWAGNDEESFERTMGFLDNSRIEDRKRLWWKIARYGLIVVLLFLVIVVYADIERRNANKAEAEVVELKEEMRIDSVQTNDNSQHIDALENTVRVREDTIRVLRDRNDSLKSLVNPFLSGHQGAVQSVAFSPDGQTLASATAGPFINVWDVTLPHPRLVQRQPVASDILHTVRSVAFSRDGTRLASGNSDGTIGLWTVETG
ncbi:MAG: NACHT and WD repeat domain-containing protein, partial [Rhodothermales bacterium]